MPSPAMYYPVCEDWTAHKAASPISTRCRLENDGLVRQMHFPQYPDVHVYYRARDCSVCGRELITVECEADLIDELVLLRGLVNALEAHLGDERIRSVVTTLASQKALKQIGEYNECQRKNREARASEVEARAKWLKDGKKGSPYAHSGFVWNFPRSQPKKED